MNHIDMMLLAQERVKELRGEGPNPDTWSVFTLDRYSRPGLFGHIRNWVAAIWQQRKPQATRRARS